MVKTTAKKLNPFYDDRLTVWVFCPTDACPMNKNDLLAYSHLAHADRQGWARSGNQVCEQTGISRNTITKVMARLEDWGLLVDGVPQPKPEWFAPRKGDGGHWSSGYAYWVSLVRAEGSPLTVGDTAVFSYLLHRHFNHNPDRWSYAYVTKALKIDERSVASSIDRLVEANLLQVEDGVWRVAVALVGEQTTWFRKKKSVAGIKLEAFVPQGAPLVMSPRKKAPVKVEAAPSEDDDDGPDELQDAVAEVRELAPQLPAGRAVVAQEVAVDLEDDVELTVGNSVFSIPDADTLYGKDGLAPSTVIEYLKTLAKIPLEKDDLDLSVTDRQRVEVMKAVGRRMKSETRRPADWKAVARAEFLKDWKKFKDRENGKVAEAMAAEKMWAEGESVLAAAEKSRNKDREVQHVGA